MPNVAEIVRNVTLGASIVMPGGVTDQARRFDTSSSLPQGRTELVLGMSSSRIDRSNPVVVLFDQASPSASPSIAPSAEPSPSAPASFEPGTSFDPNASLEPVDPCVTEPVPAAGEEPVAAIGEAGGLTPATPAPNSEAGASLAPSATPDGSLPPTDTDGDGVIDGDVDGDGDVDEDDKTAAACPTPPPTIEPSPSTPPASASPEASKSAEPTPSFPTTQKVVDTLIGQKGKEIGKPSFGNLKRKINHILSMKEGEYANVLAQMELPYSGNLLTEEFIIGQLGKILNGNSDPKQKNIPEEDKIQSKQSFAAGLAVIFVFAYSKTDIPELKTLLLDASYTSVDYGVTGIDTDPKHLKKSDEFVDQALGAIAQSLVGYQIASR